MSNVTPPADLMALKKLLLAHQVACRKYGRTGENAAAVDEAEAAIIELFARPSLSAQAVGKPVAWRCRTLDDDNVLGWSYTEINPNRESFVQALYIAPPHKPDPSSEDYWRGRADGFEACMSTPSRIATPPQPADGGDRVGELVRALAGLLAVYAEPDRAMCCDGRDCGCMGASTYQEAEHYARAALAKFQPAGGES